MEKIKINNKFEVEVVPVPKGKLLATSFDDVKSKIKAQKATPKTILYNTWAVRSTTGNTLDNIQFETPVVTVNPQDSDVISLNRFENIYQIITDDINQKIYHGCKQYCMDVRTPGALRNTTISKKHTMLYMAELHNKRKVINKIWKNAPHDYRSFKTIDEKYYKNMIDWQSGEYPGILPVYVKFLHETMHRGCKIALHGFNLTDISPIDQQLIKSLDFIKICT